jgi:hypothetical protein
LPACQKRPDMPAGSGGHADDRAVRYSLPRPVTLEPARFIRVPSTQMREPAPRHSPGRWTGVPSHGDARGSVRRSPGRWHQLVLKDYEMTIS